MNKCVKIKQQVKRADSCNVNFISSNLFSAAIPIPSHIKPDENITSNIDLSMRITNAALNKEYNLKPKNYAREQMVNKYARNDSANMYMGRNCKKRNNVKFLMFNTCYNYPSLFNGLIVIYI